MEEKELIDIIGCEIEMEYKKLKSTSKTYGELEKKIKDYCGKMAWKNMAYMSFIRSEMLELLKSDIGNLPIE